MGKLFNFKNWLTLPQTVRYLAILFAEEVTESDVLQLALDGHLLLSVHFVNKCVARKGTIVPIEKAVFRDLPSLDSVGLVRVYDGPKLYVGGIEKNVLEVENDVVYLEGTYDLAMIGSELTDIKRYYHKLNGGPEIDRFSLDGAFVLGADDQMCQILQSFDDNEYQRGSTASLEKLKHEIAEENVDSEEAQSRLDQHRQDRKNFLDERKARAPSDNYYPASLPEDSVLVVRTVNLRKFEQKLSDEQTKSDKPLNTNERNTLLTIIAALSNYSDIDLKKHGVATEIARMTDDIGASVSDDAVRNALNKIPDAVESRNK